MAEGTTPMTNITDEDRQAAADCSPHNARWGELVRQGHLDSDHIVQAFAKHRISALEKAARVRELDLAGEHAVTISDAIRNLK